MTGFGDAHGEENGHAYHVEIRSVNNRYLKTSIHLPEELAFAEAQIESLLRRRLTRGSISLRVYVRDLSAQAALEINAAAIRRYVQDLHNAASELSGYTIDLATLAALPGVCQPREQTDAQREHVWAMAAKLIEVAITRLMQMRTVEGQALAEDLQIHCDRISGQLQTVRERSSVVVEQYRERLQARVQQLLAESGVHLAEQDIVKEVAIFAERSDIAEEVARLTGHLEQFDEIMRSREPAGRKLEFLAQELLREANTIGSKAGDSNIARAVIEIKSAVDRIKEQVQNVE